VLFSPSPQDPEKIKKMNRILFLSFFLLLSATACLASSHGEAPREVNNPTTDGADLYAFVSYESGRSNFVTLIADFAGRQRGTDGPNFHPPDDKFFYEINVDTTGDGIPEIVYQFNPVNEFASPPGGIQLNIGGQSVSVALKNIGPISVGNEGSLNTREYYSLAVIQGGVTKNVSEVGSGKTLFRKPFDYCGHKTFADYNAYANSFIYDINLPNCATAGKMFVGHRKEAFSINIGPIFDLVNFVPIIPSEFPGGIANDPTHNQVSGSNVLEFALEVPISCLGLTGSNTVIGTWQTSRPKKKAQKRQKSRIGNPLINELFIGLPDKDKWSRRTPATDGQLNNYIAYPTFPEILSILFKDAVNQQFNKNYNTIAPTNFPRQDLVALFLQGIPGLNPLIQTGLLVEMLRLNTAIAPVSAASQNNYGVFGGDNAGFPNGRRPGDDIVDMYLQAAMGKICTLGLGVCSPSDAVVGTVTFTDGAPIVATDFLQSFPYFNVPNTNS